MRGIAELCKLIDSETSEQQRDEYKAELEMLRKVAHSLPPLLTIVINRPKRDRASFKRQQHRTLSAWKEKRI